MKLKIGENYWKLLACVAILFSSVAVTSCSDDDDEGGTGNTITTSNSDDGDSQQIKGKLRIVEENDDYEYTWGSYVSDEVDEIRVYAEIETEGYYDSYDLLKSIPVSKGEFTYTLPTSLGSKYLWNVADYFEEEGFTVSNKDAKSASIWFEPFKNDLENGYISLVSSDFNTEVELVYVDRDVKVSGTYKDEETYDGYTYAEVLQYDVNLKKGWNTLVVKSTGTLKGNTYTETTKVTANNEPSSVVWAVEFYNSGYGYLAIDESSNESVRSTKATKAKKTKRFFKRK